MKFIYPKNTNPITCISIKLYIKYIKYIEYKELYSKCI